MQQYSSNLKISAENQKFTRNSPKKTKNPCYYPKNPQNPISRPVIFAPKGLFSVIFRKKG